LAVIDYGDCWFDAHQPWTIRETIKQHALRHHSTTAMPKCSPSAATTFITYPLLQAHAEKYGKPLSLLAF
jgi:agmatinase